MKVDVKISPDIARLMAAEIKAGERAVSAAMSTASQELKVKWRGQITGAGLGRRLSNSIRSQVFPKGDTSLNAAGLVWSNAPQIVGAHERGPLIRSSSGFWLAIPLPAAGRGFGGRKITPLAWERKTGMKLRYVYRRGKPALLVADSARISKAGYAVQSRAKTGRNQVTAPIFVLVPQVKLKKRLDLDRPARAVGDRIPSLIVDKWVEGKLT
jgi:hypothetical protein